MTVLGIGGEHQAVCVCVCVCACVCASTAAVERQRALEDAQGSFWGGGGVGWGAWGSSADKGESSVTYFSNHTVSSALREDGDY